jgi:hypothetical protein
MRQSVKDRILVALAGLALLLPAAGCIEFERSIVLQRNLSGQAGFRMAMDMAPMMKFAAEMERKNNPGKPPPSQAEIDAQAAKMRDEMTKELFDVKAMGRSLPAGVTVVRADPKVEGLKFELNIVLAFDDVRKLTKVELDDPSPMSQSASKMRPFDGLQIMDEGQNVVLVLRPQMAAGGDKGLVGGPGEPAANPFGDLDEVLAKLKTELAGMEELMPMFEAMLKGMRETFRVEAPSGITQTNAPRREGNVRIWDYTLESLMKMPPGERQKLEMRVVLRK